MTEPGLNLNLNLKRRLSSTDLTFFTPAATSFHPRPYSPRPVPAPPIHRHVSRPLDPHALPPVGMDPLPTDTNVIFIHPPFMTFPRSHLYPDGLSYHVMAENPEWFLDADDFISQHNLNPNAIPYPSNLEPPRGWCPTKKKDLKDRRSDGWRDGEEPRLRCTFCRRTYAGVNAKSMWRRHVFEKHKIAMSNRRDGNDRPRGRGSNKENRSAANTASKQSSHDSLLAMDVDPQTEFSNTLHKSKFRSLVPLADVSKQKNVLRAKEPEQPLAPSPVITQSKLEDRRPSHPLSRSHVPPISPPLTPQSDPANTQSGAISQIPASPLPVQPVIPPSPYDPLLTPSFRHSPPRLPSDQPWRFPSPSHPLHSRSRELSLSMLLRDLNSPVTKGTLAVGESPRLTLSPTSSPRPFGAVARALELGTPVRLGKRSRATPGASITKGRLFEQKAQHLTQESPLQHAIRAVLKGHRSQLSDEWLADASLASSSASLDPLATGDPFAIPSSPWRRITGRAHPPSSPSATPGTESPVLRNATLPSDVGLGIGLLEPFEPSEESRLPTSRSSLDVILDHSTLAEEEDEAEVASFLGSLTKDINSTAESDSPATIPPLKRRRMASPDSH